MKRVLFVVVVSWAFSYLPVAHAELGQRLVTPVAEIFLDTGTCRTITISSHVPVNVIVNSSMTVDATGLEVYNIDSSVTLNCGYDVAVSTISTETNYGREVLPKTGVWFGLARKFITALYCKSQGSNATSRATITGGK